MLCEIYCQKFKQHKIIFHNKLNVVLGTETADNSIGKSTLMLIIDYAFGGKKYSESVDIGSNIGDHTIGFKFKFEDHEYYFCRVFSEKNTVYKCDAYYNKTQSINLSEYLEWLSSKYNVNLYELSFRNVVGRYSRIYGMENHDEIHPLQRYPKESSQNAITALLKLFNHYKDIEKAVQNQKESNEKLKSFKNATKHNLIILINKRQYDNNSRILQRKQKELDDLQQQLNVKLIDFEIEASQKAIQIRKNITQNIRQKTNLASRLSNLEESGKYRFTLSSKTLQELSRFFPQANFRHLEEIESFHKTISGIFQEELKNEQTKLKAMLLACDEDILELKDQFKKLSPSPKLSKKILEKISTTMQEIQVLKSENQSYEQLQCLKTTNKRNKDLLTSIKSGYLESIEEKINSKMEDINTILYKEKHNPPVIHFQNNNYTFFTPNDTGTGIAYKGLIVFDLAILRLTKLPYLIHDSLLFKQISDDAIERILTQYMSYDKQVFIAFDKHLSYNQNTANILLNNAVIKLEPNGQELFGRSWSRQTA